MPDKSDERLQAEHLLRRLMISPTGLAERESPDFAFDWNGRSIGLEVTASMYQEYRRGKLLKSDFPTLVADFTHLKDGSKRRSNKELTTHMLGVGNDWVDDATFMTDWAEKIERSLQTKRAKLNTPNYTKFAENWLLIYDKPTLPEDMVALRSSIQRVRLLFAKPCNYSVDFDPIYILSGGYLFCHLGGNVTWNYVHEPG